MTRFGDFIQIMATERCNLRCTHCAVPEEDSPAARELTTSEWFEFIDRAAVEGVRSLTLSGGEVTLRHDAVDLLRRACEAGIARVTLLTNGLLSERVINELVELQSDEAALGIHVSLDGAGPSTHDVIRGAGSFAATMRRIARFREVGGAVTGLHTVIHRGNLHELDDLVSLIRELGCSVWTVFPVASLGRAVGSDLVPLTPEEWVEVTVALHRLRADGLDVGQMGPIVEDEWPSSLGTVPRGRETTSPNIVVGPDGEMFTCPPLRAHPIGTVGTVPEERFWVDVVARGEELTRKACPTCKFRLLCTGIDGEDPFRQGAIEHAHPQDLLSSVGSDRGL